MSTWAPNIVQADESNLTWAVQFDWWKAKLLSNLSVFYLEGLINLYKWRSFFRFDTTI